MPSIDENKHAGDGEYQWELAGGDRTLVCTEL